MIANVVLAIGWASPNLDLHALLPEIIVTLVALSILVADMVLDETRKYLITTWAGVGVALATIPLLTLAASDDASRSLFNGSYVVDRYALLLKALFLVSGYLVLLMSSNYLAEGDYYEGEYSFLLVSSILGMIVMASARDLVTIFVAVETIAIPSYMLAGWRKRDPKSNEAMLKYYLLGVVASAVMLYGMSFVYGITGATQLSVIATKVAGTGVQPLLAVGILLTLIGFAFKISAVPFHQWAPDTYEGAPTPITAFLSVSSKAAGFVAITQLVFAGFLGRSDVWRPIFWVLAALTMTVGNLIALRQTNIVRMFAYSSVAQAGFIMAPLAVVGTNPSASRSAFESIIFYLVVYAFMNLGAFAMIITVSRKTKSGEISSFGGLFSYAPGLAIVMTLILASLAGIPPLGGFWAKFFVFKSLIDAGSVWPVVLACIAAVNSVIAFFYYAAIMKEMWMNPAPFGDVTPVKRPAALSTVLTVCTVGIVAVGVYPGMLSNLVDVSKTFGVFVK
jgi:NADH-quinone oxidoreductase subunit N